MKTIGIIGGMSWESSTEYYRIINERVKEKLGGLHSAKILLYSVDFNEIEELQHQDKWQELTQILTAIAQRLEKAGADLILIATNTMHLMAEEVQQEIGIPLLHIADATGRELQRKNVRKVLLLGTRFTMEKDFYTRRLKEQYGMDVSIPDEKDRELIHRVIYRELCLGEFKEDSRKAFLDIIGRQVEEGVEAVVLGCTEIPLLIKQKDLSVPVIDTSKVHALAAVEAALSE